MKEESSQYFDHKLGVIEHYKLYPEMKVWIGRNYPNNSRKLLIVGESHYIGKKEFLWHHNPDVWYAGIPELEKQKSKGFRTREIVATGIENNWREKSAIIYRNIDTALRKSRLFQDTRLTAFTEIAFMNYFQRPAEKAGKSINVKPIDAQIGFDVFQQVVSIIEPDAVIFTSSLAYSHAKSQDVAIFLASRGILFTRTPHPGMPWWNRVSKKYGNRTGKEHFDHFINDKLASQ